MSWLRIEGRMPNHGKVSPLSDAAFRLHVTAMAWCVEEKSDGRVGAKIPATLPGAPRSDKKLQAALSELADAGLWERAEDGGFVIHDFLKYNPSAAQSEALRQAKVAAGASGGRAKASNGHGKSLAAASQSANEEPGRELAGAKQDSSSHAGPRARSDSDSDSDPDPQSTTTTARGGITSRLIQPPSQPGEPPRPRRDPLGERLPFGDWFPSQAMLEYCSDSGLSHADFDGAIAEARDALTGRHDFEWFDVKIWRFLGVAIDRKKNPRRGARNGSGASFGGPSDEWPTDADLSLREAIRGGAHGKRLKAKLEAGELDAALAKRLIREADQERRERGEERPVAALVGGIGRVMP